MVYSSHQQVVDAVCRHQGKRVMAVASAADAHVLEAVVQAHQKGIAQAILLGDAGRISEILRALSSDPADYWICPAADPQEAGKKAVELVRDGEANFLMKGMMETRDLLKPVVNKENKLHTGRVMSHVAFNQLPNYPKLLINTDGGMVISPTLEEKKGILENAVEALHALGYALPKVAVLAGVEKVNPKMPETVDAAALQQMNQNGEITGCIVKGPLSYDIAISGQVAQEKHFDCPEAGDFDVLLQPCLAAGNILGKCWSYTAGSIMAGVIMGAKVPIILTSRSAPALEKFYAIAIASLVALGLEEKYAR